MSKMGVRHLVKTVKVVAAIIIKNNQVLIAQRSGGEFDNFWEFPGGKIENGESEDIALQREINEELNISISIDEHLMTIEYAYSNFDLVMDCYICSTSESIQSLSVHKSIKWICLQDNFDLFKWVPADEQIVQRLKEKYK